MKDKMPVDQVHGIAGCYGGLPDPYGSPSSAEIVLLPVPFDQTSTYKKGSDQGPAAIIEASRNMELYDIETKSEVYLKGIYTDRPIQADNSLAMVEATYQRIKHWISQQKFIVTIGGEHSISYGPIRAHAEQYGPLTIVQFDAHADLQPAYENNPWSHASVMARVKEIPQVSQIISVGIRSLSTEELPALIPSQIFYAHALDTQDHWMDLLLEKLTGPLYITFDLDVLDPSLLPSTGTPEPGGLNWTQATKVLKRLAMERQIVGIDFVELCPRPCDHVSDYVAAKLIYKFLSYQFLEGR